MDRLSGDLVVRMATTALYYLQQNEARINALNVFPVPDGDTASNMILTLKAAIDAVGERESLSQVAEAMAHGALRGARGNSGTILSQFFHGFYLSVKGLKDAGAMEMAQAFVSAANAAYSAVYEPREGTILTVGRRWGERAATEAARGLDLVAVFDAALQEAVEALEETPKLLDVLGEAGVVDAGGEGFVVCLQGALAALQGKEMAPQPVSARQLAESNGQALTVAAAAVGGDAHHRDAIDLAEIEYKYCTEFLVQGQYLSVEALKEALTPLGDSLIVVGDSKLVKVHLHTNRPGAALEIACDVGSLVSVSIENMEEQNREHVESHRLADGLLVSNGAAGAQVAVVAVAAGEGFEELLLSQGVATIVRGGQGMNPSAGELVDAIDALGAGHVIVLPNNKNIVLTAEQASTLTRTPVTVVPTTSLPQAVSATFHFDPGLPVDEIVAKMTQAVREIRTAEVTRAARDARVNGADVQQGDIIALSEGNLLCATSELDEALVRTVRGLSPQPGELVTLYYGEEVAQEEAESHAALLRQEFPQCEIEVYFGGQPVYMYWISVE